ncbi:MAG: hypothetical protein Q8J68_01110 [Methanolobus sp.]|uniref:hypothetical protein n=1 Tax=Methanolobus sp. TaxID=1874737 RepID=UPI00272F6DE9|nr:hypothetical protein [Methanolobus sp.]MDP2215883.1 hypothetical protein [Methanolobus sp.]
MNEFSRSAQELADIASDMQNVVSKFSLDTNKSKDGNARKESVNKSEAAVAAKHQQDKEQTLRGCRYEKE